MCRELETQISSRVSQLSWYKPTFSFSVRYPSPLSTRERKCILHTLLPAHSVVSYTIIHGREASLRPGNHDCKYLHGFWNAPQTIRVSCELVGYSFLLRGGLFLNPPAAESSCLCTAVWASTTRTVCCSVASFFHVLYVAVSQVCCCTKAQGHP